ncbi:heavy metal translocating P-type ATPase [Thalassomonas sp. M1454]|uniref:heavy metal translocating P-type ATPase n=1 Tax=Thalassomonas sp. M1454 TaxID=2594477 RepID=UPI00117FCD7F|nr:heavy metal translocating P-type ATPase [Thalassomonas sp. M1454]TRX56961.1 cadmium-translocating P-type ATPase [Thalassomonas sp. M1454]
MNQDCFHCGEDVPNGLNLFVTIGNKQQEMCCYGCQAVAQAIVENGLEDYYRFRTEKNNKVDASIPEGLLNTQFIDDENLQNEFTFDVDNCKETILSIDGMSCAACAWLIEKQLSQQSSIVEIKVNATTQRATVKWDNTSIKLSEILNKIGKIGYQAMPFKANLAEQSNIKQKKAFIRRLGVSGILTMQVMMIAFGLYFGAFSDLASHNLTYLRGTSFVLTLPIVTFGAFPFYTGAIAALRAKRLSMDVPVSIAIILAFSASAWATFNQSGEVYFESVAMFTFLLLIGKFLEFRARSRAAEVSSNLLKLMPLTATILVDDSEQIISAKQLEVGNLVIIKPGETIPGDGVIVQGSSSVNESMLTGEHAPVSKTIGATVYAGTVNSDGNLTITINKSNSDSFLTNLIRLSENAQAHKPAIAKLSDKIAQYFVALILLTSIATAVYWSINAPEEAFWITLSVLVATCPCALSLATPTALTCGTIKLNKSGIMIKSGHVLETVPKVDCFAFDKTGTLTNGEFSLTLIERMPDCVFDKDTLLAIASALETHSEHPIAKAFAQYREHDINLTNIEVIPGCGVQGIYHDQLVKIGKYSWLAEHGALPEKYNDAQCILTIDDKFDSAFYLSDTLRTDTVQVLNHIQSAHKESLLISGDNQAGVESFIEQAQLSEYHHTCSASDKLNIIESKQKQGKTVAMVGDGVNDSPVFAAAHVAIAMGSGTEIAKSGADVILLNNKLSSLLQLITTSNKTSRIIKQNFAWAFGYNAIVLPLAVCGFITPYLAVLGMSASSIIVVTNSLRLLK